MGNEQLHKLIMPSMQQWNAWDFVLVFLMWTIMMVAMMVPTASPVILLFAEIKTLAVAPPTWRMPDVFGSDPSLGPRR